MQFVNVRVVFTLLVSSLLGACGSSNSTSTDPNKTDTSSAATSSLSTSSLGSDPCTTPIVGNEAWTQALAINAGGDELSIGCTTYLADVFFDVTGSGGKGGTSDPITGTSAELEPIYQSERWGVDFSYNIPVSEGVYDVTLRMVELYFEDDALRVQNVFIEGAQAVTELDTHKEVGHDSAYNLHFTNIAVSDGHLNIRFVGVEDAGNVAALIVTAQQGAIELPKPPERSQTIKVSQIGFLQNAPKIGVIPNTTATAFEIINVADDSVAFDGPLSENQYWDPSEETVKQADFSALQTPGTYRLRVEGKEDSHAFTIDNSVYSEAHDAALKAYYYNRASIALEPQFAGQWARAAGHPDTQVAVIASAATPERPQGTIISAPKGWYDAGDYNKYVVNAGIATYTLLAAYEHFPDFYANQNINIPESANSAPDILDEIFWNLEWLEAMQDLDGGVYHKLSTANFEGILMPENAMAQRYVDMKTTAATLNFAAVMAVASRVYDAFEDSFPGKSAAYALASEKAWQWAMANPATPFKPTSIHTGTYSTWSPTITDDVSWAQAAFRDEFVWAASELFLLTEKDEYRDAMANLSQDVGVPWWGGVEPLAHISLAHLGATALSSEAYSDVRNGVINLAESIVNKQINSAYGVPMAESDFGWGSNSAALNQGLMVYQAYKLTGEARYLNAAQSVLDYIFGRNATEYSFVTGFGAKPPMAPHHRPSAADGIIDPVPGFVVGGPQPGMQDSAQCGAYPITVPAAAYIDDWCSYATNEITINWNAPLVYLLAAVQQGL